MKMKLFAALMCVFVALSVVCVFADEDDLGDLADDIVGEQTTAADAGPDTTEATEPATTDAGDEQTSDEQSSSSEDTTEAPVTTEEPVTQTEAPTEPVTETETETQTTEPVVIEPEPIEDTTQYVPPTPVETTTAKETEKETKKPAETSARTTTAKDTESESESEKQPETSIVRVTEDTTGEAVENGGSNFSSASHVVAYLLGIPLIISVFALILAIIRRIVYKNEK